MERVIQTLLTWYNLHCRKLPWRETSDPYKIWLSEVILQQTRVVQGMEYYHKFVEKCKTVNDLANLEESEVLKLWQGLGYYSRARNLHKAAKNVVDKFGGHFPKELDELQILPGVGGYTANAIRAFAFNLPAVAIDGNVKRVASRWLGSYIPINKNEFSKEIYPLLMDYCVASASPNIFNQALIELGATVCTPSNPNCEICPLRDDCFAFRQNLQKEIPVLEKKKKPITVEYHYAAINQGGKWAMYCRPESEIWAKLYEFPLATAGGIEALTTLMPELQDGVVVGSKQFKHQLTHRTVLATCWVVNMGDLEFQLPSPYKWVEENELADLAIHRLMEKMMKYAKDCISS